MSEKNELSTPINAAIRECDDILNYLSNGGREIVIVANSFHVIKDALENAHNSRIMCECTNCCDEEHAGYCYECAGWGDVDGESCENCDGSGICPKCNGKYIQNDTRD